MLAAIVLVAVHSGPHYVPYEQIAPPEDQQPYQAGDDTGYHWLGDSWAQWLMMVFSAVAAAVSLGALHLLSRTFDETERTAKAAIDANDIARLSNERQLRAYVTVKEIRVKSFVAGERAEIDIILINTGQTPARNLRCVAGAVPGKTGAPIKLLARRNGLRGPPSSADLGASNSTYTVPVGTGNALTQQFIERCRSGDLALLVGGYASYTDVFGKLHRLVFSGTVAFNNKGVAIGVSPSGKNNRSN
ncbi:MAG: hypothetical protein JNL14_08295 [Devosia sp.]|uniref:hypothetical protein n=1 Tax=Devosia sp. TaxID=1871048 RepID=UPI001A59D1EF|nr:hypothetical protein [Devosia sp.]MBL8597723.1 hypothetical protein [Devosia sp.]